MTDSQRNFLIIIGISVAAVVLWPLAAGIGIASMLVNLAFMLMILAAIVIFFRRNSLEIAKMKPQWKIMLYGSAVLGCAWMMIGSFATPMLSPIIGTGGLSRVIFYAIGIMFMVAAYTAWQRRYD